MNFLRVVIFSLLVIAFFAVFSNFGIPQIEPAPPPEEEVLDLEAMSMDQFIALGERILNGKGTCTLCHNPVGGRAPLLDGVVAATEQRLQDPVYKGSATDLESYLYESMVEPSAYVVAGFGKAGTGDTESPMPDVSAGGIGLSAAEINAVIAYLQDIGGAEVTAEIVADVGAAEAAGEEGIAQSTEGKRAPYDNPEEAIGVLGCGACHKVAGQVGALGPDLSHIGANRDAEQLRRAILKPNAEIAEGYTANMMPDTYGEQLYANELEMLVQYLAELK
jgi:cbb3-type cytochrome oxidase cytochrome c subunit